MIRIEFDKRFYPIESVRAAAQAWRDVVELSVGEEGRAVVAAGKASARALNEACGGNFEAEFRNQALWETKR